MLAHHHQDCFTFLGRNSSYKCIETSISHWLPAVGCRSKNWKTKQHKTQTKTKRGRSDNRSEVSNLKDLVAGIQLWIDVTTVCFLRYRTEFTEPPVFTPPFRVLSRTKHTKLESQKPSLPSGKPNKAPWKSVFPGTNHQNGGFSPWWICYFTGGFSAGLIGNHLAWYDHLHAQVSNGRHTWAVALAKLRNFKMQFGRYQWMLSWFGI